MIATVVWKIKHSRRSQLHRWLISSTKAETRKRKGQLPMRARGDGPQLRCWPHSGEILTGPAVHSRWASSALHSPHRCPPLVLFSACLRRIRESVRLVSTPTSGSWLPVLRHHQMHCWGHSVCMSVSVSGVSSSIRCLTFTCEVKAP